MSDDADSGGPDEVGDGGEAVVAHHAPAGDLPPISRLRFALMVAPIVVFWLMNMVQWFGQASLLDSNPMLLMALGPSNRNVVFTADKVHAGEYAFALYVLVGTLRLLGPDASFFALGRRYGDRAIVWMERRTATMGSSMRSLERLFAKAGHALVVIMPNNPVCLLAGASGMPVPVFATLNVIGTIGRMFVLYWVGKALSDPIAWFLDILREHRPWFIAVSVISGLVLLFTEFRKGTTEVQAVAQLEESLEEDHLIVTDEPSVVPGDQP